MWDIVGIDRPCVDVVVDVRQFPHPDGRETIRELCFQGGGKTANGLCAAARLGARCALMGTVGTDRWADFCQRDLAHYGVDASRLIRREGAYTSLSIVISDEETGGRSIMNHRSLGRTLAFEEMEDALLRDTRYLYLPWINEDTIRAAQLTRAGGGKVMLDADSNTQGVEAFLPLTDVLICAQSLCSAEFAKADDRRSSCERIRSQGPEIVLFTCGAEGLYGCSSEGYFELPAYTVPVKDSLGAGDAFHGAFLVGLLRGRSVRNAAEYAAATAAIKCTQPGGRAGLPDQQTLERFLRDGTLDWQRLNKQYEYYQRGMQDV